MSFRVSQPGQFYLSASKTQKATTQHLIGYPEHRPFVTVCCLDDFADKHIQVKLLLSTTSLLAGISKELSHGNTGCTNPWC
jgi:hypothetical protein